MLRQVNLSDALSRYLIDVGTRETTVQKRLREETAKAPHAGMQSGPDQAQFMSFLIKAIGARNALEIGVFRGYSALAVAAALPDDGTLVACDMSAEWTNAARPFWREAGVESRIDLRLAPALDTLDALIAEGKADAFDFAFIDADKSSYDAYYERCLILVRRGGVIAIDNVLWSGAVVDANDQDKDTVALRALNKKIRDDNRVDMCLLPIGDGVTLVRRR
ncbi:MAG TPA: class I SAM-dependent methyltransferase [Beijerinckiaceae bacterium]|nr:class I SAM-dependent methyltransferase [Beijerinckiaceae bacterium]